MVANYGMILPCLIGPGSVIWLPLATSVYEQTIRTPRTLCTLLLFLFLLHPTYLSSLDLSAFTCILNLLTLCTRRFLNPLDHSTCNTSYLKFELIAPPIVQSLSAKGPRSTAFSLVHNIDY